MADALRATVSLLKNFDGTPSRLDSFLNQINTFHARYFNADPSQQEFVILAIKAKITGEAEDFLLTRPDLETWDEIRVALIQKFSDPITRANLHQQLIFLSRQNESTQDYIQKLKALVTKINTKICSEIQNVEARAILISQNELTATQNLLANIPNELRTLLIVRNPQNLDDAIDIITNYEILTSQSSFKNSYLQNNNSRQNTQRPLNHILMNTQRTHNSQYSANRPTTSTNQSFRQQNPPFRQQNPPFRQQNPPFRQQNQPFRQTNQSFGHPNHTPRQLTQSFQQPTQSFQQPTQSFQQPNQNSRPQYPQPMSGISIQPKRTFSQIRHQPNHFRPTGKPNFAFQELTHLENNETNFENNDTFTESNYYSQQNQDYEEVEEPIPGFEENDITDQFENFRFQASDQINPV